MVMTFLLILGLLQVLVSFVHAIYVLEESVEEAASPILRTCHDASSSSLIQPQKTDNTTACDAALAGQEIVILYGSQTVFSETAEGLHWALLSLGCYPSIILIEADPTGPSFSPSNPGNDILYIVIGPDFLSWLPDAYILYQMENLDTWLIKQPGYATEADAHAIAVWEFSPRQISFWLERGIPTFWLPIYVAPPSFGVARRAEEEGGKEGEEKGEVLHVLFYGGYSPRRALITRQIEDWAKRSGRKVMLALGHEVMGEVREEIVTKAQVVLNLHSVEARVLEVHRLNYLLSRGKCIVSEWSTDLELDAKYAEAVYFTDIEGLEERIDYLLQDRQARHQCEVASHGFIERLMMQEYEEGAGGPLLHALVSSLQAAGSFSVVEEG